MSFYATFKGKFYKKPHRKIAALCKLVLHNKTLKEMKIPMSGKEMHKAVCADCGKECEVPFEPDPSRPVYCRECWAKRRSRRRY
jgi:CxxC-x17-CxxC domain-containing protein